MHLKKDKSLHKSKKNYAAVRILNTESIYINSRPFLKDDALYIASSCLVEDVKALLL